MALGISIENIVDILPIIGAVTLVYTFGKLVYGLYKFYIMYYTDAAVDLKSFGKWSLVTGSTDGIGKGIAQELAKRGINVILVSRNPDKLKIVADEIKSKFQVETKCVTFDFSRPDNVQTGDGVTSMYDVISDAIEGLEVGILVNNVGLGAFGEFLNAFSKSDNKDVSSGIPRLIYCNDLSMVKMTQIVLPEMLRRKNGLIINITSLSGFMTMPYSGIYAGSKRFGDAFSKALNLEYKNKGIIIQSIQPGPVKTNMTSGIGKKGTLLFPAYETYAAHLLKTIGKEDVTTGYRMHGMLKFVMSITPENVLAKIFARFGAKNK